MKLLLYVSIVLTILMTGVVKTNTQTMWCHTASCDPGCAKQRMSTRSRPMIFSTSHSYQAGLNNEGMSLATGHGVCLDARRYFK